MVEEPQYVKVATRGGNMARARQQARGMPISAVSRLAQMIDVPEITVLKAINLTPATYHRARKKPGQRLARDQTETVSRMMRLFQMASDTLPHPKQWFHTPSAHLEGETPFDIAQTEDGGRVVESLLQRIEYGSVA